MKDLLIASLLGAAALLGGCCSCTCAEKPTTDAEGFTYLDGRHVAPYAPSDWYIIRYEHPSAEPFTDSRKALQRWLFTEVRQLKDSVTVVEDGVLKAQKRFIPGRNWRKWLRPGARNVRVKFVGADYSISADGLAQTPAGFTSLFNGKDLSGWRGCTREEKFNDPFARREMKPEKVKELQAKADALMKAHWHVRDGALFFDGLEGGYSIAAAKDYGNVEIIADWRLLRIYGDSGFYLRGMPQVQIWDPNMWNGLGSGCIWNNPNELFAATERADHPIGDWNTCRMRIVGDRVSVWLNGVKVVDNIVYQNYRDPKKGIPACDRFELQCHGDPVEFRNVFVKELP
ncbi:MAG: DUF1080 domain-containing protein [Kiritimatiellae bacterium]|nr:DUF1080 domain-containing protein [Kiritimatiellia bacterium]